MSWINHTLSKWLYAIPFTIFGLFHFLSPEMLIEAVPKFLPGAIFWIYLTGAALILAGISIISGKFINLACKLLAVMLLVFVFTVSLPGIIGGNEMMMQALLKDLSLAGAALFIGGQFETEQIVKRTSKVETSNTNL
ncbi:MAG: hypothetical protein WD059_00530 [Balneolaceae bacterium]